MATKRKRSAKKATPKTKTTAKSAGRPGKDRTLEQRIKSLEESEAGEAHFIERIVEALQKLLELVGVFADTLNYTVKSAGLVGRIIGIIERHEKVLRDLAKRVAELQPKDAEGNQRLEVALARVQRDTEALKRSKTSGETLKNLATIGPAIARIAATIYSLFKDR